MSHPLLEQMNRDEPRIRRAACAAIASDPAGLLLLEPLRDALSDPDPGVRRAAGDALAALGRTAAEVDPLLLGALRGDDPGARFEAARALATLAPPSPKLIPALIEGLGAARRENAWEAARLLVDAGRMHGEVAPIVIGLVRAGPTLAVRRMALACLRELAPDLPEAAEALDAAAVDPSASLRRAAFTALPSLAPFLPQDSPSWGVARKPQPRTRTKGYGPSPSGPSTSSETRAPTRRPGDTNVRETWIITGGTGALGNAIVDSALAAGHRAVVPWIASHEHERISATHAEAISAGTLVLVESDIAEDSGARAVVEAAGEPAVLVNGVGGFGGGTPVHETDLDLWDRMYRMNVRTAVAMCRAAVPGMAERGHGAIVNIASQAAFDAPAGIAAYAASKAAIATLTRSLQQEVAAEGIRVNAVVPTTIDTPANREAMPDADFSAWTPPTQIAGVIAWLASEAGATVRGGLIPV